MQMINKQYNPETSSPAIEQRKPYPANAEEAKRFRDNLMEAMHSQEMHPKIMQVLQSARQNTAQVIGQLAAKIVMSVVMQMKKKTGRQPQLKMALYGLKMVIQELGNLCRAAGIANVDTNIMKQAGMIAGKAVEDAVKGYGKQMPQQQPQQPMPQPMPQQQPQGYLGGM